MDSTPIGVPEPEAWPQLHHRRLTVLLQARVLTSLGPFLPPSPNSVGLEQ